MKDRVDKAAISPDLTEQVVTNPQTNPITDVINQQVLKAVTSLEDTQERISSIKDSISNIKQAILLDSEQFSEFDPDQPRQTLIRSGFEVEIEKPAWRNDGYGYLLISFIIPGSEEAYKIKLVTLNSAIRSSAALTELVKKIMSDEEVLDIDNSNTKLLNNFNETFAEIQLKHAAIMKKDSESRKTPTLEFIKNNLPITPDYFAGFRRREDYQAITNVRPGLHVSVLQPKYRVNDLIPGEVTVEIKDPEKEPHRGFDYETYGRASLKTHHGVGSKDQLANIVNQLLSDILDN